ncbi:MAG: hypothetical protein WCB85_02610, partial [Candidatus Dormiibacterota bacterium]
MPDQLVCTGCWRWYDGRTTCPACRRPLVDPVSGSAVSSPGPAATASENSRLAPPVAGGLGAGRAAAPGVPPVHGYPSGLTGEHLQVSDYLVRSGEAPP